MAAIKPTVTSVGRKDGSALLVLWANVGNADTCVPYEAPDLADKSLHVYGTFGGGSVSVKGSNNGGLSSASLRSPDSVVIAITAEDIKAVLENTQQIWPLLTGGAGSTLNYALLVKQSNPLRQ